VAQLRCRQSVRLEHDVDSATIELAGNHTQTIIPLALDLDGTVCRTDTLIESLLRVLAEKPLRLPALLLAMRSGPAAFKHAVAAATDLDPATLIYNDAVLGLAREARAAGRSVFLVTAAGRRVADQVAAYLGLFDGVMATDGARNLKGQAKADALVAKFGAGGFDYAGDANADRPVWRQARQAILVAPEAAMLASVRAECTDVIAIGQKPATLERLKTLMRALRVHQWAKNVLVFVPLFAAHIASRRAFFHETLALIAFSLCASSVYVLNDLVDLPHDRMHARKRLRPFASGALNLAQAPLLIGGTLLAGFVTALFLPRRFLFMLAVYYACTVSYSFVLKRRMVWDVMMLAGLYTIRVFAGAAAISVPVSPWLLAFSMFLFFCLAVVKRLSEVTRHVKDGRTDKISGRGYLPEDIDMLRGMAAASGYMAVLVLALYVNSPELLPLYRHPDALWVLCPILLFWVSRVLMLSHRGDMHDDPVVFALRDRVSLLVGAAAVAALIISAL
jgi:4-hydroxybenzoate polyprenyltransferase/phosphoserine phosphatase